MGTSLVTPEGQFAWMWKHRGLHSLEYGARVPVVPTTQEVFVGNSDRLQRVTFFTCSVCCRPVLPRRGQRIIDKLVAREETFYDRTTFEWMLAHAIQYPDQSYGCKLTGAPIQLHFFKCLVYKLHLVSVEDVGFCWCPACQPNPRLPRRDLVLYENEVLTWVNP